MRGASEILLCACVGSVVWFVFDTCVNKMMLCVCVCVCVCVDGLNLLDF